MEGYPKTAIIKDGVSVLIRPLTKEDGPALFAFFNALPENDRLFLREDVTNQDVIKRWITNLDYDDVLPLIAEKDSRIIGDATLHFSRHGWRKHMAEIRCVVASYYQRKGVGTTLMRELLSHAERKGVNRISAEMMASQRSAQKAFQRLGFKKAGELKDFVTDMRGTSHNLIVMVNDVSQLWKAMEDMLIGYDTGQEH